MSDEKTWGGMKKKKKQEQPVSCSYVNTNVQFLSSQLQKGSEIEKRDINVTSKMRMHPHR